MPIRRRTLIGGLASAALAAPAIAQKAPVLRFVPQSNLTALDPIWTTATVTGNHGYYVYDTLYSADSRLEPRPQMAEGHEVSPTAAPGASACAKDCASTTARPFARRTVSPA